MALINWIIAKMIDNKVLFKLTLEITVIIILVINTILNTIRVEENK